MSRDEHAAARKWAERNAPACMCSAKIDAKGATLDTSACPIHGKSKARR